MVLYLDYKHQIFIMKNCFNVLVIGCVFLFTGCASDSTDDLTDPVDGPITYEANVRSIFDNNCVECHSGATPPAGLRLETYAQVRDAVEFGNVLDRMTDAGSPMPPNSAGGLLPAPTVELIQQWAENDFPEE